MPTFDTPGPIVVSVEIGIGDVRLLAADRTDTVVDVAPSDRNKRDDVTSAEQVQVELVNDRLLVKVPKSWKRYSWFSDGGSVDVRIELPTGSQVTVDAGMAALHGTGRLGSLRCKAGIGDVELEEVGALDLRTGMGDMTWRRRAAASTSTPAREPCGSARSTGPPRSRTPTATPGWAP